MVTDDSKSLGPRRALLTDSLIHLTKGELPEAERTFRSILKEKALLGGNRDVRGGSLVVCFSDVPVDVLRYMLTRPVHEFRYAPFGVMVTKQWLFDQGGLPVIYQPESDYKKLSPEIQYRHVRFDTPGTAKDFTFEREWRVPTERLPLDPKACTLVVPTRDFDHRLRAEHAETRTFGRIMAFQNSLQYRVLALEDLGVSWEE